MEEKKMLTCLSIVIVDDEPIMAEELKATLLELYPDVHIAGVYHDGETALSMIRRLNPHIVFLDIQMPGMTGMEVANYLAKLEHSPMVVFVTAYDEFAIKAFEVNAVDYILKPLDENDLQRVMAKIQKVLRQTMKVNTVPPKTARKFSVEKGDRMEIVDIQNIKLVYAKDRMVYLLTLAGESFRAKLTLQEFAAKLPPDKFFRCHRNYIVNIDQIKQIATWFKKGYLLILKDEKNMEIPVGRAYVSKLKEYIEI
jgi:DNA-binding LytR/AlgR family response regulator